MSRLAKKPVQLLQGVTLKQEAGVLTVKGPKGELKVVLHPSVEAKIENENIRFSSKEAGKRDGALGTAWSLTKNAVKGVAEGFRVFLEIEGVGYRVVLEGKELVLFLGYALPVRLPIPEGVALKIEKNTIEVSGIDKELVGRFAAEIRSLKKPEPYKGKGIHYRGEIIKRKVGKKAGATTAS
jgi:large subunit ribosomal protein L6